MKRIIAVSNSSRGGLDDDYTMYDNGEVLHEYDRHIYPGGQNLSTVLNAKELKPEVKQRLIAAASDENRKLVEQLLTINGQHE
ncbi:hypothetical protein [Pedobacter sp. WC2423]|uniref:hypothetical protein n=1 Tax=Pedobacter sp. WC2423 TaxID=3234142 RepID=UPI00346544E1